MTRSSICWNMIKKNGTKNSKASVPISMPPIVPNANALLPLAPTPLDIAMGIIPNTIVRTVIRIGRRRTRAASREARTIPYPSVRLWEAYSVSRMAVFDNSPISISSPVCI